MAQRNGLRASDADREQVADRLRRAAAEGRLLAEELEQRLSQAFRARTYGELDAIVADLPGERLARAPRFGPHPLVRPALAVAIGLAAVAIIAAVVVVIAGVLAVWGMWALLAWWLFGSRARRCHHHWHVHTVTRQAPRAWL